MVHEGETAPVEFDLYSSTASVAVNAIDDSGSFAANRGADFASFGSLAPSVRSADTLKISGLFSFDPRDGTLLLDIRRRTPVADRGTTTLEFSSSGGGRFSRRSDIYTSGANNFDDDYGLITAFGIADMPAPGAAPLLPGALAAPAGLRGRA